MEPAVTPYPPVPKTHRTDFDVSGPLTTALPSEIGFGGWSVGYRLGVDLGTTYTAAAVNVDGRVEMLGLGIRAMQVPSVVFVRPDGEIVVGEAAEQQGAAEPSRVVREFKRRIGDSVPLVVGGAPFSAQALTARLLAWVVGVATERHGGPPEQVCLT